VRYQAALRPDSSTIIPHTAGLKTETAFHPHRPAPASPAPSLLSPSARFDRTVVLSERTETITERTILPAHIRIRKTREQLQELTGYETVSVSGLEKTGEGWRLAVDVVELRRVPDTASVLATYRVTRMTPVTWRRTNGCIAITGAGRPHRPRRRPGSRRGQPLSRDVNQEETAMSILTQSSIRARAMGLLTELLLVPLAPGASRSSPWARWSRAPRGSTSIRQRYAANWPSSPAGSTRAHQCRGVRGA
jgi:Gas vesicle synthesis protein GvpO